MPYNKTNFRFELMPDAEKWAFLSNKKGTYYHYTTLDNARKIINGNDEGDHFFFAGNIEKTNDVGEKELHSLNSNKLHVFCTCKTESEKIPLWYLYSGVNGNGARIGITPAKMRDLITSVKVVYPVIKSYGEMIVDKKTPLKINEDFALQCGFVYYCNKIKNSVKYLNRFCGKNMAKDVYKTDNYFVKDYPWEYESEFRIVLENKTNDSYDLLAIPLPEKLLKYFKLTSAPERAFDSDTIKQFTKIIPKEKIGKSSLNIKMDLLKRNKNDLIYGLSNWCEQDDYFKLCNMIKETNKCNAKEPRQ